MSLQPLILTVFLRCHTVGFIAKLLLCKARIQNKKGEVTNCSMGSVESAFREIGAYRVVGIQQCAQCFECLFGRIL
jgi:hypothetical protein